MATFFRPTSQAASGTLPKVLTSNEAAPTANFSSSTSGQTLTLDATSSTVPSGLTILSYRWDFPDGQVFWGQKPVRYKMAAGSYSVKLTVTDSAWRTATVTKTVTVLANVADNFNRSNSTTLGTAADGSTSKAWAMLPTSGVGFGVQSNRGKITSGSTTAIAYVDVGATVGSMQMEIGALQMDHARSAFLAFRVQDIQNFWFLQFYWAGSVGGHGVRILKKVANANTTIWTNDIALAVGDVLTITDDASTPRFYWNGILQNLPTTADTALNTATKVGFGGSFSSDPTTAFDNFRWYNSLIL